MKKHILYSTILLTVLGSTNVNATMYDEFTNVQKIVKELQVEVETLREENKALAQEIENREGSIDSTEEEDEVSLREEFEELEDEVSEISAQTAGDNLKLSVDFRTSVDNLQYKMTDGSRISNNALMINRFWLNMNYKANDNLSFTGQLAYNKAFGERSGTSAGAGFETFDWISNENAYDDLIRVRSAYFFYKNDTFFDLEIPWTFSIGRRPSTGGHLINYREDDTAASPSAHTINVEFDGLSSKFTLNEEIGMYIKFCAGRGYSNAQPRFSATAYADAVDTENIDLGGLIFVPYDDGQYQIFTQFYYANNLIDAGQNSDTNDVDPSGFHTVGGLSSATAAVIVSGIGDEWSDYLDDSTLFFSAAFSLTNPDSNGGGMLGSHDKKLGLSTWIGLNMPSIFTEDGLWGLEYNAGSKYWRSITYGEDTNIGSKIAARGDAYEIYFTEPLMEEALSMQLRATYIDYKYTGSNGFFGSNTGTPHEITTLNSPAIVDSASDIRFYIRYKY